MRSIGVIESRSQPISKIYVYDEFKQYSQYTPYVFCENIKLTESFFLKNVIEDPKNKILDQWIKKKQIDILHSTTAQSGIDALPVKQKWQIPLITSFEGYESPDSRKMKKKKKKIKKAV